MFKTISDLGLTRDYSEEGCNLHTCHFKRIRCGEFYLSIHGSNDSYCEPMASLPAEKYKSMEVALFDSNNNWVKIHKDKRFNGNPILKYFPQLEEYPVAGFVPVRKIVAFANFLVQLSAFEENNNRILQQN